MGADSGFLRLITVPEVKTCADLRGKQVSVDAMTTGYAFVLRKLLEEGELKSSDIQFVSAGGVMQRFLALMEKKHAGTLLIPFFEVNAQAKGFNCSPMPTRRSAAIRGWSAPRAEAGQGTTRRRRWPTISALASPRWTGSTMRGQQGGCYRTPSPNMSGELAVKSYDILLDPKTGFRRRAELDVDGVKTVLSLRSEYGEPRKQLTDAAKYFDLQYYRKARGL